MTIAGRVATILAVVLAAWALPVRAGEIKPFVSGSWAEVRAGKAPAGPLIVHLWGLTCAPCRTEMPEWGKLRAEVPSLPLVLIHAETAPPKTEAMTTFLANAGLATAESWYFAERFLQKLRFEIDPTWQGEMPATLLIGRDGAVRTIIGTADLDEVRRWFKAEGGLQ